MDRREYLGTIGGLSTVGSVVVVSGCLGGAKSPTEDDAGQVPSYYLRMKAVTDLEIAKLATRTDMLSRVQGEMEFVAAVVEDGPLVTRDGPGGISNRTVVFNGSIFKIEREILETADARSFRVGLSLPDSTITKEDTIHYDQLPDVDKKRLDLETFGWIEGEGPANAGIEYVYNQSEINRSELVPTPSNPIILWDDGTRTRFRVVNTMDTTIETYRYSATLRQKSARKYGRSLRATYAFSLDGLSDAEARIITNAIETEDEYQLYKTGGSEAAAFLSLSDKFDDHGTLDTELSISAEGYEVDDAYGTYLVRYDGPIYWTVMGGSALREPKDSKFSAGQQVGEDPPN